MTGKELGSLSFKELQHLEHQLHEGILAVKDRKVYKYFRRHYLIMVWRVSEFYIFSLSVSMFFQEQVLLEQIEKSKLQVKI